MILIDPFPMQDNGTLETVDLSWNGFADNGAVGIGLALKTNVSLTVLDLSANRIGPIGIGGLARGLEENTTLRELLVSCSVFVQSIFDFEWL